MTHITSDGGKHWEYPRAYVKMRERGKKAFWFVTSSGEGTRLRIHAATFASPKAAQEFVDKYAAENPELEFKVSK